MGLEVDDEGRVYAGVATLGDADIWPKASGGPIFRYDPRSGEYEFLCIPIEHDYVQGFVMDRRRGIIYGDTFPGRKMFRYDIGSDSARVLTMLGDVSTEHLALDADGGAWHTYELMQWAGRYPLLRYDPDRDEIDFTNVDLPDVSPGIKGSNQMDSSLLTERRDDVHRHNRRGARTGGSPGSGGERDVSGKTLRRAAHEGTDRGSRRVDLRGKWGETTIRIFFRMTVERVSSTTWGRFGTRRTGRGAGWRTICACWTRRHSSWPNRTTTSVRASCSRWNWHRPGKKVPHGPDRDRRIPGRGEIDDFARDSLVS